MALFDFTGLGSIAELLKELVQLFPNAEQRAAAANKIQDIELAIAQGQLAVNAEEAKSDNWFVAGWRPACGWLCVGALGYNTVLAPAIGWGSGSTDVLIGILTGLLGLGTMRSVEKIAGKKK